MATISYFLNSVHMNHVDSSGSMILWEVSSMMTLVSQDQLVSQPTASTFSKNNREIRSYAVLSK